MSEKENPQGLAATGDSGSSNGSTAQSQPQTQPAPKAQLRESLNSLLRDVTRDYIKKVKASGVIPTEEVMERELLAEVLGAVLLRNSVAPKEDRWRVPSQLEPVMIAELLVAFGGVRVIETGKGSYKAAVYDPQSGLYVTDEDLLRARARAYRYTASQRQLEETLQIVVDTAKDEHKTVRPCTDPRYAIVGNGIYDRQQKALIPYTPELVFTNKTYTHYDPNATNPILHSDEDGTDWDIESGILEWAGGDPEVEQLLWEVLYSFVFPMKPWDKMVCLYGPEGCNGKGTFAHLCEMLVGDDGYESYNLADMCDKHSLEGIEGKRAIIGHENDVGFYLDSASRIKALITNDSIMVNPKNKTPYRVDFMGIILQCFNARPRARDRSFSFARRLLLIPFPNTFITCERRYIKHDYIERPEVREYVLKRILEMDVDEFSNPAVCQRELDLFREANSPVIEFANYVAQNASFDLLPREMLWDMFSHPQTGWRAQKYPGQRSGFSERGFYEELVPAMEATRIWSYHDNAVRVGDRMDGPEPLIVEFGLDYPNSKWGPGGYRGPDKDRKATPASLAARYRGFTRNKVSVKAADAEE